MNISDCVKFFHAQHGLYRTKIIKRTKNVLRVIRVSNDNQYADNQ